MKRSESKLPQERKHVTSSYKLSRLHAYLKILATTEELAERALQIYEARRGSEHADVANALVILAGALRHLGEARLSVD